MFNVIYMICYGRNKTSTNFDILFIIEFYEFI